MAACSVRATTDGSKDSPTVSRAPHSISRTASSRPAPARAPSFCRYYAVLAENGAARSTCRHSPSDGSPNSLTTVAPTSMPESNRAPRDVLEGIRKPQLQPRLVAQRTKWIAKQGPRVGLSLMFGSMSTNGVVLENKRSLPLTRDLTDAIRDTGVQVAGFYPNVQTVLPGTQLARGMAAAGHQLDFYRMPRAPIFDTLEDGGVGYNFLTVGGPSANDIALAEDIVATAHDIQKVGVCSW